MVNHLQSQIRILHLEDRPYDVNLVADLLDAEHLTCAITPAANRKQFELALENAEFDVILCDYNLTDFDGLSALNLAKEKHPATPVIIVSGTIDAEEAVQCLKAGASDYLLKQRLERLPSAVQGAMERNEMQRQRKRTEDMIHDLNANLERRVEERTAELEAAVEDLRDAEALLLRNDKLISLGRMCAGLIHEINNPLNYALQGLFLLGRVSENLPEPSRAEFLDTLDDVREGVTRVERIVSDLRGFTRPSSNKLTIHELKPVVDKSLRFFSHEIRDGLSITADIHEEVGIRGDPNQLVQVLVNLIQNSLESVRAKRFEESILPEISITTSLADQHVIIKVRDNGLGIPAEIHQCIFDPFFTTKDVGAGMGLSLTICHRIITEFGGEIEVNSEQGIFCEIILKLPALI